MNLACLKVLGLEQYGIAHDKGSSHGESRIIRIAYHEAAEYVPLLKRAWDLWKQLQQESQQVLHLLTDCTLPCLAVRPFLPICFSSACTTFSSDEILHEVLCLEV